MSAGAKTSPPVSSQEHPQDNPQALKQLPQTVEELQRISHTHCGRVGKRCRNMRKKKLSAHTAGQRDGLICLACCIYLRRHGGDLYKDTIAIRVM
ncbi:hypothetical protein N7540_004445 [Penicillium herquei]|nr:hypothetical protein N7540_004445 [Penicillium herquei]